MMSLRKRDQSGLLWSVQCEMMKSWVSSNEAVVVVVGRKRGNWKMFMSQSPQDVGIDWM